MIKSSGGSAPQAAVAQRSCGGALFPWARAIALCLIAGMGLVVPARAAPEGQQPAGRPLPPGEGVEVRLPSDLVFGAGAPLPAVVFRHTTHTAFAGGQCSACHPQPFKILHPTRRTNHAEMNAGRSCGTCHDGKQAFGVADAARCARCHAAERAGQ